MDRIITINELLKMLDGYNYKELHVHHTWRPNHDDWQSISDGLYWQNSMRHYHVHHNGWSDIGQHVTLLPDGKFVTGRDFGITPASIKGKNTGAFACEMLGNFDIGHDVFGGEQKKSIILLARYFYKKGRYIRFHRENSSKTCPGSSIDKIKFMDEVKNTCERINFMNVKDFQRKNGLDIDGIVGPKTIKKFLETATKYEDLKNGIKKIINSVKESA